MRGIPVFGAAALLAVLPVVGAAQTPPAPESVVERNTTIVVKESPKPSPVSFMPYGFFLTNAFFTDSPGARAYPTPSQCVGTAQCGGAFLIDVRQTRLGARLVFNDTAGWTGATLTGLVEIDFNGGYGVGVNAAANAVSSVFYSPVIRLRKAYADASWGSEVKFTLRIGQDDRLVSPLRPVSLAYVANPLFQNAGLLHGRAPMAAARFDITPKNGIAISVAAAALDPMDTTVTGTLPAAGFAPAIDFGAGNRSRVPNFEGRIGVGLRMDGKKVVDLGGWAGWQKNRYFTPNTDTAIDQNTYILGGDMTLNLWIVQVLGSIYKANGYEIPGALNSQGVAISVAAAPVRITNTSAVPAFGGWFQVAVGPPTLFQVYGGWGGTQTPFNALTGSLLSTTTPTARAVQSYMWAVGAIGYAGKNWRFSAEYAKDTTWWYAGQNSSTIGQFSLNSQVVF